MFPGLGPLREIIASGLSFGFVESSAGATVHPLASWREPPVRSDSHVEGFKPFVLVLDSGALWRRSSLALLPIRMAADYHHLLQDSQRRRSRAV